MCCADDGSAAALTAARAREKLEALISKLRITKDAADALRAVPCNHVPRGTVVAIMERVHGREAVGVLRPVSDVHKVWPCDRVSVPAPVFFFSLFLLDHVCEPSALVSLCCA